MKLPASLAPWAQQLKIFPDEISIALGTMAQKLSPFISPLRSQEQLSDREPNGYDGVARRGIYERLLLSELALADEIPEEFIRRAVMGEHLFLNLARVAPSGKRISVALLSAGPEQLGTPRIAHLAALIVLWRRAESVKAAFSWGILQDTEPRLFSEVSESTIANLISARTAESVEGEQIQRWRENLIGLQSLDDVWLVGDDEIRNFEQAHGFSFLTVEDVLEPNARQLQISVRSSSGLEKQTVLELPDETISTRLLRNPFEVYRSPEKVNLATKLSSFFFDDNGGKIFARGSGNAVLYIPVSNSPHANPGKPRQYSADARDDLLLAAGRLGKSVATISLGESGHLKLAYPKFGNFRLPMGNYLVNGSDVILPADNNTLLPIYNLHFPKSPFSQAAFLDAGDKLFTLNKADEAGSDLVGRAFLTATNVLAAARTENRFVFVGSEETKREGVQIVSYGEETERRELPIASPTQAFFGRGIGIAHKSFGLLAIGNANSSFAIVKNGEDIHIDATIGSEVVGVYYDPSFSAEVGLIELGEDRRTLSFNVGRSFTKHIFSSGEEIEKIVFSHRSPVCAYQTGVGEVIIFSLSRRVPIGNFGN